MTSDCQSKVDSWLSESDSCLLQSKSRKVGHTHWHNVFFVTDIITNLSEKLQVLLAMMAWNSQNLPANNCPIQYVSLVVEFGGNISCSYASVCAPPQLKRDSLPQVRCQNQNCLCNRNMRFFGPFHTKYAFWWPEKRRFGNYFAGKNLLGWLQMRWEMAAIQFQWYVMTGIGIDFTFYKPLNSDCFSWIHVYASTGKRCRIVSTCICIYRTNVRALQPKSGTLRVWSIWGWLGQRLMSSGSGLTTANVEYLMLRALRQCQMSTQHSLSHVNY